MHAVIVGLCLREQKPAEVRLFSYHDMKGDPSETRHAALTAYLVAADALADRHLVVGRSRRPSADVPVPHVGSKPVDGGHLIVDSTERDKIVMTHPDAAPFIRPYIGGEELLNGGDRWIICVQQASPQQLQRWSVIRKRIEAVRTYRLGPESGLLSKSLADTPAEFHVTVIPEAPFIALPEVSSERRAYLPVAILNPPAVPSNKIIVIDRADLWLLGMLSSAMHMAWLRHVGGRLKSDYQYSSGLVYNTFPWPDADDKQRQRIETLAQAVLNARAQFSDANLAALYDPDLMKPALRRAHTALDAAVDRLYRPAPFTSERERAEFLFALYERLTAPALAAMQQPAKRRRRTRQNVPTA